MCTSSGFTSAVPSTASMTSCGCSLPSAGLPAVTESTITSVRSGLIPWAASAAVIAWSSESSNIAVFCWVASSAVCPSG